MTTTSTTIRMTGRDAIAYAQAHGLTLFRARAYAVRVAKLLDRIEEGKPTAGVLWMMERLDRDVMHLPTLVQLDARMTPDQVARLKALIARLAEEASAAGDEALALACAAALDGDEASQRLVVRALVDAVTYRENAPSSPNAGGGDS